MNQTAKDFLTRCFAPGSTIALLLRTESPSKDAAALGHAANRRLRLAISAGSRMRMHRMEPTSMCAANPLRSGSRKRTKESIASIRHVYLDIDDDGDARLAALRASDAVPPASAILSTSPSKYQVFWRVEGFDFEQQELTLKRLAIAFGGDPACTDCNRVLRIPGFLNRKYSPALLCDGRIRPLSRGSQATSGSKASPMSLSNPVVMVHGRAFRKRPVPRTIGRSYVLSLRTAKMPAS